MPDQKQPWWAVDMQGMLAIAIVVLMAGSIGMLIVLSRSGTPADQQIFSVLTTLLGVLAGSFKDVYGWAFGSSKGSQDQQSTITKMAVSASSESDPTSPITTTVKTTGDVTVEPPATPVTPPAPQVIMPVGVNAPVKP